MSAATLVQPGAPAAAPPPATPPEFATLLSRHPEYDSPAKRANYARLVAARDTAALTFDAVPDNLLFEPHASCNLRCCWAQQNPKHPALRPRGAADLATAERIIAELGPYLYHVRLGVWGEPTINRNLPALVRKFHDARIGTWISSNMTLIDENMAEGLVASRLDAITCSIDGLAQETYEKYRVLGKVDRAMNGLLRVIEAKRRLGSRTPHVEWQFLVFEHNQHEVAEARALAERLGVDSFGVWGGSGRSWTPETGLGPREIPPRPAVLCDDPWRSLWIDWDGAVHLCCRAFKAEHVMGDMREQRLIDIYQNDRFQLARRVIRGAVVPGDDEKITCTACNRVKDYVPEIAALGHTTDLG